MALNFGQTFAASLTWTVLGTAHGIGHPWIRAQVWDSGAIRQRILPGTLAIHPSTYTVTVQWGQAQAGLLVLGGAAPLDPTTQGNKVYTFPASTTWTVPGTSHGFATDHLLIDAYDAQTPAHWLPAAIVRVDQSTYTVTVQWGQAQAGSLVISAYADVGTPNYWITLATNPQIVPGTTHNLGTAALGLAVYDAQTPMQALLPAEVTVHPTTFDVSVAFAQSQAGTLVLGGSQVPVVVITPPPPVVVRPAPPRPLALATSAVLGRLLRRLPASLWDTDPTSPTLQRDLYGAMASQEAVWFEQQSIANDMTLLMRAQGIDLDVLMQDYGLKRYVGRPDPYARQIAEQILFRPRCTLYAVQTLADLLFDLPHVTLRTGSGQSHVLVSDTHPITAPMSYWGMISQEGLWYGVTVDGEVPTISQSPPVGVDQSPGPHTLSWFTVRDEHSAVWYVTIQGETLVVSQPQPAGYGTTTPLQVQDAGGTLWTLSYTSVEECLISTAGATGQPPIPVIAAGTAFDAVQLQDPAGTAWWLSIEAEVGTLTSTLPTGATDVTPTGGPYAWLRLYDAAGGLWYGSPTTWGTLLVHTVTPGGLGTPSPQTLGDAHGVRWHLGVHGGAFTASSDPQIDYGGMATAICLRDATGRAWFWRVRNGRLEWSPALWPETLDQSPWGDLGWLTTTFSGTTLYVYPSTIGQPLAAVGPPTTSVWGWMQQVTFVDAHGGRWHLVVSPTTSNAPGYWQMLDETGTVVYLGMDAEVPSLTPQPPSGGVDQTPGGTALAWFMARDEGYVPWFVTVLGDALQIQPTRPDGLGTAAALTVPDALGTLWTLTVHASEEALVSSMVSPAWQVSVAQDLTTALPTIAAPLSLRDAVEAISHVQAAGSLVTVLLQ